VADRAASHPDGRPALRALAALRRQERRPQRVPPGRAVATVSRRAGRSRVSRRPGRSAGHGESFTTRSRGRETSSRTACWRRRSRRSWSCKPRRPR
jgi:hypothetical protein